MTVSSFYSKPDGPEPCPHKFLAAAIPGAETSSLLGLAEGALYLSRHPYVSDSGKPAAIGGLRAAERTGGRPGQQ